MARKRNRNMMSWILFLIGLAGVIIPHVGFLANLAPFSNLNVIAHPILEIISAILILIAYLMKK